MPSLHVQFKVSDTQEPVAFAELQRLLEEGYRYRDIFPPLLADNVGYAPENAGNVPVTAGMLQAAFEQQRQEFEALLDGLVEQIVSGVLADVKSGKLQPTADDPFEAAGGKQNYTAAHAAKYSERYKKK